MTYQLYVGANNSTGRVELGKIKNILSSRHQGFTMLQANGYWQGQAEPSVCIIVNDVSRKVHQTIRELKSQLQQDAIGYQIIPDIKFA